MDQRNFSEGAMPQFSSNMSELLMVIVYFLLLPPWIGSVR